jgi:multiple sugar transport system ATP-binding protein
MNFVPGQLAADNGAWRIILADGSRLELPSGRWRAAHLAPGKEVLLGIRPEHIARASTGPGQPGTVRLNLAVGLVQPTGTRTYATCLLAGTALVAELGSREIRDETEHIGLDLDLNRAILIDRETDRVL